VAECSAYPPVDIKIAGSMPATAAIFSLPFRRGFLTKLRLRTSLMSSQWPSGQCCYVTSDGV